MENRTRFHRHVPLHSDDERTYQHGHQSSVDATKTPEWAALQKHYDELQSEGISLKQWFADDAERVEKLSFDAGDLHFDLSKNLIKPETLQLFADLAKAVKLDERTKAMYTGVHINNTEDRAVLHTALRRPAEDEGQVHRRRPGHRQGRA